MKLADGKQAVVQSQNPEHMRQELTVLNEVNKSLRRTHSYHNPMAVEKPNGFIYLDVFGELRINLSGCLPSKEIQCPKF